LWRHMKPKNLSRFIGLQHLRRFPSIACTTKNSFHSLDRHVRWGCFQRIDLNSVFELKILQNTSFLLCVYIMHPSHQRLGVEVFIPGENKKNNPSCPHGISILYIIKLLPQRASLKRGSSLIFMYMYIYIYKDKNNKFQS
jgi:hypothetical protein